MELVAEQNWLFGARGEDVPVFCRITSIFVFEYMRLERLTADHSIQHFHVFEVFETYERNIVKANSLDLYRCFDVQMAYDRVMHTATFFLNIA